MKTKSTTPKPQFSTLNAKHKFNGKRERKRIDLNVEGHSKNTAHGINRQNKLNAAIQFGLVVDCIEEDEQIHRVATLTKPRNKNGWYVSYGDILVMGNWSTGESKIWKPTGHQNTATNNSRVKEAIARNKLQKLMDQKQAAVEVTNIYENAQQVAVHPYLSDKGIDAADGLRFSGKWLLVPLYDVATNELVNLQRIATDGKKLFSKGAQIRGAGCPVGLMEEPTSRIFICEGYATAASIHQMTHQPVVAAMNAGNLLSVARAVRRRWPDAEIVIAGDNDWLTEQKTGFNPGKHKAMEASALVAGALSFPPFNSEQLRAGLTDWNDYLLCELREIKI